MRNGKKNGGIDIKNMKAAHGRRDKLKVIIPLSFTLKKIDGQTEGRSPSI